LGAAAVLAALAAGWTATAAPSVSAQTPALPLPTPSLAVTLPAITVAPLPTPSLPIPSLPSLPLPTPALTLPTAPRTGPAPTAAPGSSSSSSSAPTSPWFAGGAPPSSGSAGGDSLLGNTSAVLGSLLALLGTPANVGVEQPTLEHFGTQAEPPAVGTAAHGSPPGGGGTGWPVIAGAVLVAVGAALVTRRRAGRWYRAAGIAAVPTALVLAAIAVAVGTTTGTPTSTPVDAVLAGVAAPAAPGQATSVGSQGSGAGYELLGRISGLENAIARQAADLQALAQPRTDASQAPGRSATGDAQVLAGQQRQLAVRLEATLQQEYVVYASAAQDPGHASALVAAASAQPARIHDAVDYDVQAVQAALAQQAAIAGAAQSGAGAPLTSGSPGAGPTGNPMLSPPLAGAITQGFGPTTLAFEPAMRVGGITYPHFHTGLDIAAPMDTPVQAAAAGVVALAGAETDGQGHLVGYGNYVVIAHGGGMLSLYGHLDKLLVKAGQAVHAGDPIGLEGSTGNSTGAHCHFEVRVDGVPVDPRAYLRPGSL
jgi:murein DD-endopeptidase MepM/ murein hydrolase activator NlpD